MTPGAELGLARRRWHRWWWAPVLLALLAVAGWYVTHPPGPGPGLSVRATTKAGSPVYVAALGPVDRDLTLGSVEPRVTGDAAVQALVCRGGRVRATADATAFCAALVPADGAPVAAGDSVVLRVTPTDPGPVDVDRVAIAFRDGLRWGRADVATRIRVEAR